MNGPLQREINRLKAAILEYDRALQWRECPDRARIAMHRNWDLANLGDYICGPLFLLRWLPRLRLLLR
jgi:hypothetical protein